MAGSARALLKKSAGAVLVLATSATLSIAGMKLVWNRGHEAELREETEQRLRFWRVVFSPYVRAGVSPPTTTGAASPQLIIDDIRKRAQADNPSGGCIVYGYFGPELPGIPPIEPNDAWGHPFIYRCPGTVHSYGWDLYSVGPNGVDELGQGDDILIGDDLAPISSAH